MTAQYRLTFDGGAEPNPGRGYGSYEFEHVQSGRTKLERFEIAGDNVTNNEAEWRTLIQALQRLRTLLANRVPETTLTIKGDSQLVLKQLSGEWNCYEPRLIPLRDKAWRLLADFASWSCQWTRRDEIVALFGH